MLPSVEVSLSSIFAPQESIHQRLTKVTKSQQVIIKVTNNVANYSRMKPTLGLYTDGRQETHGDACKAVANIKTLFTWITNLQPDDEVPDIIRDLRDLFALLSSQALEK